WMRVGQNGNVRAVNGTMYKLLNAKSACILTRILSPRFVRQSVSAQLFEKRKERMANNRGKSYPLTYGLIGLKARSRSQGWGINTTLHGWSLQKELADTSQNTSSSQPFSQLIGLKAGSASATLKAFQKRRSEKPTR
ncbi:MAG TPA: hypothetical protein VLK33_22550, partial [Terriglobales bacterium]|nr:hypothetical protein [Terriglobales bacterium]